MKNTGLHHVSVLSSDAERAYYFYHHILGLKLILKTVNQDDPNMYHLFFGDETGRAGTEFTVFEMKGTRENSFGTNSIERTMFLVRSEASIRFWENRLTDFNVCHYGIETYNGQKILRFEDEDGQKLGFVYRNAEIGEMEPFIVEDIPEEHAILGIGDVYLRVRYTEPTQKIIEENYGFEKYGETVWNDFKVSMFRFEDSPFKHEIHIIEDKKSRLQHLGTGGIHHIAFGVEDVEDLEELQKELDEKNVQSSGIVNREFIVSSYFREPNYNLFETATPLSKGKDSFPKQGRKFHEIPLFLPEFLEKKREEIERNVNFKFSE
ncbi:MAG: VOC family protein [Leptotrichiaceae bacterium]|nr:VOC family protein [Leptotrichiaceae bacterium]